MTNQGSKEKGRVVENAVGEPFRSFIHSKKIEFYTLVSALAAASEESSMPFRRLFCKIPRIIKLKRNNALPSGSQSFFSLLPVLQGGA